MDCEIDNIHTPFDHANDFWFDCLDGQEYLNMLISCVSDCEQHNIRVAVVHLQAFQALQR